MKKALIYKKENSREVLCSFMDGVLQAWPYPHETHSIPTRFGQTHVLTAGDKAKPPLVMLHGSMSNLLSWGADIPQFMQDFYVVAPDIPGHAGKSDPVWLSWENDDMALWLDDLLNAMQIKKTTLMGLSLGGFVAAKYASQYPDRVERLVLNAPGGIVESKTSAMQELVKLSGQKEKGAEKIREMIAGEDVDPFVARFLHMIGEHMVPRAEAVPVVPDEDMKKITAPMLIIIGEKDIFFDAVKMEKRVKSLKLHATVHIVPEGSHALLDQAKRTSVFIREGLK
jgi:pimeloyl-ACP methyl ester carboxylesterase